MSYFVQFILDTKMILKKINVVFWLTKLILDNIEMFGNNLPTK